MGLRGRPAHGPSGPPAHVASSWARPRSTGFPQTDEEPYETWQTHKGGTPQVAGAPGIPMDTGKTPLVTC